MTTKTLKDQYYNLCTDVSYAVIGTPSDQSERIKHYKNILSELSKQEKEDKVTEKSLKEMNDSFTKGQYMIFQKVTHQQALLVSEYIHYFYDRRQRLKAAGCSDLLGDDDDNTKLKIGVPIAQLVAPVLNIIKNVAAKAPNLLKVVPSLLKRLNLTRVLPLIRKQLSGLKNLGGIAKTLKSLVSRGGRSLGQLGNVIKKIPLDKIIDASTKAATLAGNVATVAGSTASTIGVVRQGVVQSTEDIQPVQSTKERQDFEKKQRQLQIERTELELQALKRAAQSEKQLGQTIPEQKTTANRFIREENLSQFTQQEIDAINQISSKLNPEKNSLEDVLKYGKIALRAHEIVNYINYHVHIDSLKKDDVKNTDVFKAIDKHLIGQSLNQVVRTAVQNENGKRVYERLVPKEIRKLEPSIQLKVLPVLARFIPLLQRALPTIEKVIPIVFKEKLEGTGDTALQSSTDRIALLRLLKCDPCLNKSSLAKLLLNKSMCGDKIDDNSTKLLMESIPPIIDYVKANSKHLDFSTKSTMGLFDHINKVEAAIDRTEKNNKLSGDDYKLLNSVVTDKKSIVLIAQQRIKNNLSLPKRINFSLFKITTPDEKDVLKSKLVKYEFQLKKAETKRDILKIKLNIKKIQKKIDLL